MHATPPSRFRQPWLIVTLAAIGVIALAAGVVHFAQSSCAMTAASRTGPAAGEALFYNPVQAEDRCSIEPLARDGLYASLPAGQYQGGAVCGAYLDVAGPRGSVRAEIVDMCPGCASGQLDLSTAAFAAIQSSSQGTARVSYQLARDPALPGPLAVRVGPGSNAGTLAIQILNHGNPLSAVQVNGRALSLRPDGYWIAGNGAGTGPFTVRVADADGNNVVLTGITLRPGVVQQTGVQMYGPTMTSPSRRAPGPSPGAIAQHASMTATPGTTVTTAAGKTPGC
jgi:expansin